MVAGLMEPVCFVPTYITPKTARSVTAVMCRRQRRQNYALVACAAIFACLILPVVSIGILHDGGNMPSVMRQ